VVAALNGRLALALLGIPIAALLVTRPKLAALSVVAGFFMNGMQFETKGLTVRPEEVAVVVGLIAVGLARVLGYRRLVGKPLGPFVVLYLLLNVTASILHSPDSRMSLLKCAVIALAIGGYFLVVNAVRGRAALAQFIRFAITFAILESLLALVSLVGRLVHISVPWFVVDLPQVGYWAVTGTMMEPNIFGSTIATLAILYLGRYLVSGRQFTVVGFLGFVVLAVGVLCSYTRGAWLGFAVGLAVLLWERRAAAQHHPERSPALSANALVIVVPILAVVAGVLLSKAGSGVLGTLGIKLGDLLGLGGSETGAFRFGMALLAIGDVPQHWLLGHGADSFSLRYAALAPAGSMLSWYAYAGLSFNIFLQALYDTGVVGLANICLLLVLVFRNLSRGIRHAADTGSRDLLRSLKAALICLLVCYQATGAVWLVFFWVMLAVTVIATEAVRPSAQSLPTA